MSEGDECGRSDGSLDIAGKKNCADLSDSAIQGDCCSPITATRSWRTATSRNPKLLLLFQFGSSQRV